MAEIYQLPSENSGNAGMGNIPFSIPIGGFGMSDRNIKRSLQILSTYNSGMTVSSDDLRMSAMFIGKSSSMSQFWNTIAHECSHLVDAISSYYNVGCSTEDRAYLQGFIFQRIVEEIADVR